MRDAVLVRLARRGCRSRPRRRARRSPDAACVGDDGQAGGQTGDFDAHAAAPSRAARLAARMNCSTARLIDRQRGRPAPAVQVSRQASPASAGRTPQAASTASGNLAGCAVPSTTIGIAGSRVSFSATATPTAVCGSTQWPVSRSMVRMVAGGLLLVGAVGGEQRADLRQRRRRQREAPRLRERAHQRAHRRGVAAVGLEQQPLEIRRHLDVHRRRRGRAPPRAARRRRSRACAPGCR